VVDFFAARREGTHAIYIAEDGKLEIETVAQVRGQRPWSVRTTPLSRARREAN
jgi:hypothetical protein